MQLMVRLNRRLLRALATYKLGRERPRIVGITGSVGKTTTKEAVFTVLSHHFGGRVRKSVGNLNTEEGVPLSILNFADVPTRWQYPLVLLTGLVRALLTPVPKKQPILVLELAAEKPGDIAYLTSFLAPYLFVGIVTTVGPIHLNTGQFSSIEAIAKEKGRLVEVLPKTGWAVLNRDNPYTKKMKDRTHARVIWFSEAGIESAGRIARAVGKIFKISDREIEAAMKNFVRPYGRLQEFPGTKGSLLIDDSYNANPMSVEQALLFVERKIGRKIVVLGDMLELGAREKMFHEKIGRLARAKSDVVLGVGRRARWYQPTYHFATPQEAAHFLKKFVRAGDIVLVKGSQSMRMELVSEALLSNPADAAKLPRQTPAWKAKSFVQP